MPRLRRRALSTWAQPGEPVTWHARDGAASWAAVTDLHQQGQHDDAVALARFLHWCDQQAAAGTAVWVIEEASTQTHAPGVTFSKRHTDVQRRE